MRATTTPLTSITPNSNTATGAYALYSNTTASWQHGQWEICALFQHHRLAPTRPAEIVALYYNTTGYNNTASGICGAPFQHHRQLTTRPPESEALTSNTTGGSNTATGSEALSSNITGSREHRHWSMRCSIRNATGYN